MSRTRLTVLSCKPPPPPFQKMHITMHGCETKDITGILTHKVLNLNVALFEVGGLQYTRDFPTYPRK